MTYKDIAVMAIQRAIYDYKHALEKIMQVSQMNVKNFFIHSNLIYYQNVQIW